MDHNESSPDFSEALLYRQNNKFIEGNSAEPHNAQEIRDNLDSRLGSLQSKFSLLGGRILVFTLFILNLCFAVASIFIFMYVFHIESLNVKVAGIIGLLSFIIGTLVIPRIGRLLLGNRVSDELKIYEDTPTTRKEIYQTLIEAGEVVNGTIVDVVDLAGESLITYTVKTPDYEVILKTFKTRATTYTCRDTNKEVAVLYLNETVNALL
jgi:hypothetical protein